MAPHQAANTKPVPNVQVLLMNNHPKKSEHILHQLFHEQTETGAKRLYPTPDTSYEPKIPNKIERRIYDKIITLRGEEQLNRTITEAQRKEFLSKFNWYEAILNEERKARVEHLFVIYYSIFAKHRLDIGINTEFKVKVTPQHN